MSVSGPFDPNTNLDNVSQFPSIPSLKDLHADQAMGLRNMQKSSNYPLRVLSICSGKGGVGKSCIAVNLACAAAQMGRRVLLLDADLGLANVEILLGIRPRYHLGDLLEDRSIHEVMAPGPHGIRILAGGSGLANLVRLGDGQKQQLIAAMEPLEETFDTVIIDAGAGIGDNVRFFVGAAHERILVVNPEPTSLSDAYATVKVLSESGVPDVQVLVNSVHSEIEARTVFKALAQVADQHLKTRVHFLGAIPKDGAVPQAVMARKPVVDLFPRAPAAQALQQMAARFFQNPSKFPVDGGLKFLWNRLMRESAA
ncbi:MAG: MinD/ParA family protein [Deltaproteobacteria bacterium]|nr:MinD/ParA family protein [Deltaproteobacteria bacterium]